MHFLHHMRVILCIFEGGVGLLAQLTDGVVSDLVPSFNTALPSKDAVRFCGK
jgi:hypothetical protein